MGPTLDVMQDFKGEGNIVRLEKIYDFEARLKELEEK